MLGVAILWERHYKEQLLAIRATVGTITCVIVIRSQHRRRPRCVAIAAAIDTSCNPSPNGKKMEYHLISSVT